MALKTNKSDVIANFVRYYGRQPNSNDMKNIDYLTTKSPAEVESLLAKNSPITRGLIWADYQKKQAPIQKPVAPKAIPAPKATPSPQQPTSSGAIYQPGLSLNKEAVNHLFSQYYGRNATQEELNYWTGKTTNQLEGSLAKNAWQAPGAPIHSNKNIVIPSGPTGTPGTTNIPGKPNAPGSEPGKPKIIDTTQDGQISAQEKAALEALNAQIDAMGLSMEQKAVLKELVGGDYVSGQKIPTTEELNRIIQDAATNAEADLAPYYKKITGREIDDLKLSMARIREDAAGYQARETMDYKSKVQQTKQSLRARGLTFSGTGRRQLGAEGIIKAEGVEGELPEARRMDYEAKMQGWQREGEDLGIAAERRLGTEAVAGLGLGQITTPYQTSNIYQTRGGITTGDIELEKIKEKERSKWDRVSKYRLSI